MDKTKDLRNLLEARDSVEALRFKSLLLDSASDAIMVHDLDGRLLYVNDAACAISGYCKEELLRMRIQDLDANNPEGLTSPRVRPLVGQKTARFDLYHKGKDGRIVPVEIHARIVDFDGRKVVAGIARDISERKQAEEMIKRMAYYDPLTGLPNRALFIDRLKVALAHAKRNRERLAIMFLDLDDFKSINDTLGHVLGDELMREVAERLRSLMRESDTVARLGGDEFTLLLSPVNHEDDAETVAERILDALAPSFKLHDHEFHVTASVGIALFPGDGRTVESLLKNADSAMYRAKEQGRNNYQVYTPAMNAGAKTRLALETSLRHALERDEFVLHYQPQVNIETGRVVGIEALIRWNHPERGLIQPLDFIPLAEETGLIVPIGVWVLRTTCEQNKAWQTAGLQPVRVSVNLSARQFQQQNLVETVTRILDETGLDPGYLELEITESIAMRNAKRTIKTLASLKEKGVLIAIDDFGTGYSSLSYLKRFPIHTLKIAEAFVHDVGGNPDSAAIASTIIALAKNLKLNTVAEGVETEEQLAFLRERRCHEMQGFLFSHPVPGKDIPMLLDAQAVVFIGA
ncbi:MAG: EAL domain-containing protein [Chloroflexi bacterium]|nr:EAL domain-containing protein [Chloroflexota bacterium]